MAEHKVSEGPAGMPPELETWTKSVLGPDTFEKLESQPLVAVALASERLDSEIDLPILESWAVLLSARKRELGRSERVLRARLAGSSVLSSDQSSAVEDILDR